MTNTTIRLFTALWPDESIRGQLAEAAGEMHSAVGGRRIAAPALHMTLAFIGSVPRERLGEFEEMLGSVKGASFELRLGRLGCWPGASVGWIGLDEPPAPLLDLNTRVWDALGALGIPKEQRPFRPHVTLCRKAHCRRAALPDIKPISWPVREFCLIESRLLRDRSQYEVLRRWPLSLAASDPL